jgi:hypothetical protein
MLFEKVEILIELDWLHDSFCTNLERGRGGYMSISEVIAPLCAGSMKCGPYVILELMVMQVCASYKLQNSIQLHD